VRIFTGVASRMVGAALAVAVVTAFVSLNAAIVYFERRIRGLPPDIADAVERQVLTNAAPDFDGLPEFALAVAASALLGSMVGVVLAFFIARPVTAVAAAARRVASGDLGARVLRRRVGRDEVGGLVADFNAMADSLAGLEAERRRTAAALAHELRTPVTILRARLDAAREEVLPLDGAALASLVDQTTVLGRLIDDLKTLSLADAGQLAVRRSPVDVLSLAASVVAGFEATAAVGGVRLLISGTAGTVDADRERLAQVLANLVDNAVRHTPAGGTVEVTVTPSLDLVRIVVADTGPGIPEEEREAVFGRFVSGGTDSRRHGTGVGSGQGLAIACAIARAHGGDVTSEPRPGGGAAFCVTIPR